jgi:hypothetical protein
MQAGAGFQEAPGFKDQSGRLRRRYLMVGVIVRSQAPLQAGAQYPSGLH